MQYQLFVQQSEQKFIATVVGMPMIKGEGVTETEAIALAKISLQSQLVTGRFVDIAVDFIDQTAIQKSDSWLKHLGLFANDPGFDDFLDEVANYRKGSN